MSYIGKASSQTARERTLTLTNNFFFVVTTTDYKEPTSSLCFSINSTPNLFIIYLQFFENFYGIFSLLL